MTIVFNIIMFAYGNISDFPNLFRISYEFSEIWDIKDMRFFL